MVAKTPTTTGFSRKWAALLVVAMLGSPKKGPPRQPRLASSGKCFRFWSLRRASRILVKASPQFVVGGIHAADVGFGGGELMASPGVGSRQVADPATQ